jgi:lipopolysaccharide export system permease protein
MQIGINPVLTNKVFNLTNSVDSLDKEIEAIPDTTIDFDTYFSGLDSWIKSEIVLRAKDRIRVNTSNINLYQSTLTQRKRYNNKYEMEIHRKYTLSIAVLIFFFIGAPLGAIIRKGGLGMPVVVSILLFVLYYIVSMTGEKSAREDVWQMFTGMWFSTLVFLPIGVWLSYKAASDSALMSAETYTKLFSRFGFLNKYIKLKKSEVNKGHHKTI